MTDKIVLKLTFTNGTTMVWRITKDGICYRSYDGSGYNYHNIRYRRNVIDFINTCVLTRDDEYKFYLNTELFALVK